MKKIYFLLLSSFIAFTTVSQTVVATRVAELQDVPGYQSSGEVTLTEFSDGSITLSLGTDFMTDRGPDVQIFLVNTLGDVSGGLFIADIGTEGGDPHFRGARTYNVPSGTSLEDYDFITLQCFRFNNILWGEGTFATAVVTSIFDNEHSKLELFPNPATNAVNITLPEGSLNAVAEIYSAQGNLVNTTTISSLAQTTLNVDALDNGIYNVVIRTEETTFSEKLIIE